ncbi:hypothetical protein BFL35_12940 [Clavibacter michiganensis]|nr:hypothetical protein BFL35_12940 [Clavibacter michiganensis]
MKPMPATNERPSTSIHLRLGSRRMPGRRVTSSAAPVIPTALPTTSATMMPSATLSASDAARPSRPPTATPAEKNAKTGTATPAETGLHRSAKWCVSGWRSSWPEASRWVTPARVVAMAGTRRPSATPAMVAWIPDACTSAHAANPSGMSRYQARTPRCTRNPKTASGTSASSSGTNAMLAV